MGGVELIDPDEELDARQVFGPAPGRVLLEPCSSPTRRPRKRVARHPTPAKPVEAADPSIGRQGATDSSRPEDRGECRVEVHVPGLEHVVRVRHGVEKTCDRGAHGAILSRPSAPPVYAGAGHQRGFPDEGGANGRRTRRAECRRLPGTRPDAVPAQDRRPCGLRHHFLVLPELFTQTGHSLLELPSVVGTDPMAVLLVLERLTLADQGLGLRLVLLQAPRTQDTHRISLSAAFRRAYHGAEPPRPS